MKLKIQLLFVTIGLFIMACAPSKQDENLNFPEKLLGVEMRYTYSGGNQYAVKFEKEGLSYQYRTGAAPEKWWGSFKYNHMMTDNNEHFVSWFEPGYGDYVTLLVNFDSNVIYGSAIIKGKIIHFQRATIQSVKKP